MAEWKWYVYIIECQDRTYYTGLTWQSNNRWVQHLSGLGAEYTKRHKPKAIVYLEEYISLDQARRREKQIKNWSQAKKRKPINSEWGKWQ